MSDTRRERLLRTMLDWSDEVDADEDEWQYELAEAIEAALVTYEDGRLVAIARAIHAEYYPGAEWVPEMDLSEEKTALEAARVALEVLRAARGVPTKEA